MSIEENVDALLVLPTRLVELESSVQHLFDKFDEFQRRLQVQEKATLQRSNRVDKLQRTDPSNELAQLKLDLDNLEGRSRSMNIEILGVPESEMEDLMMKVNEIAAQMKLPLLNKSDVAAMHRLPAKPGRTRGIIIRFTHQELRDTWLANKKQLKGEGHVFFCENMTRLSRVVLSKAKEWARTLGYAYVWYSNGNILVRRMSGDRAVVIPTEDDLASLAASKQQQKGDDERVAITIRFAISLNRDGDPAVPLFS
ncbi:uncharacterized protein LOC142766667 [Rhipicephalus microplus]|uniref:uncharacterized protein LOC142766667 n=1 Tax=Rhipicephalus microplus TaxID=6941 RepID=UPI003F6AA621